MQVKQDSLPHRPTEQRTDSWQTAESQSAETELDREALQCSTPSTSTINAL